ncbi:hypothetical protein CJ030_MR3G011054 [Morella rubra]|uniref:Uncharacterized protein n=1 Tax=Morella rubra TaxID=262757 RepID=A0A6A1W5T5_9ROSI|nr:hypothetical protein CJ030_MR3G011054 [Morella rubra]
MASSISTASSQGNDDCDISTALVCKCNLRARSRRSMTAANPGYHFYSCILYGKPLNVALDAFLDHVACDFFKWIEPPVAAQNEEMLADLVGKLKRMDEQ